MKKGKTNRMILPQAAKANDGSASVDSNNPSESSGLPGRAFSPSMVSGMQWRPGSSFQNQSELVCYFFIHLYPCLKLAVIC